jgi:SPP1 family predicted phage head-tail adaptor
MIGEMRERVVLQSPTLTSDSRGGASESWSTVATVWAKIEPKSASQVLFSQQLQHRITHKFTIRYRSDVLSTWRITFDSRTFHIQGVRDLMERGRYLEIDCEEGTGVAA